MIFIILLFFLLFPHSVFAEYSIKISGYSATDQEYVELINNSSSDINLDGWIIRDDNSYTTDDIFLTATDIISANSSKQFINKNDSTWLNNDKDIIYLYDNAGTLIDKLSYPIPTNTPIPTPTSAPTNTPTPTTIPTPTNTPTPDPTITNPDSSTIYLTEFMPYTDPEWIELYNNNDFPVKLTGWKIEDSKGTSKTIDNLSIPAKGYSFFELTSTIFDNNYDEKVILKDQNGKIVKEVLYSRGFLTRDRSWSYISGSWCQASITKGYVNVTSCYIAPTSTEPTPTPTSDPTKYTADDTATESAIIEPKSESSFITPESSFEPSPTITSNLVLGDSTSSAIAPKKNYLPLILIIVGGALLISPTILAKIKSKK